MEIPSKLNYQPLYKQIKALILRRVIDGIWAPGEVLPSEQHLGREFGVSQGTIRKALDEMTSENIFVRKQGKGTFVAQHSANRSLFHFFYIIGNDGKRVMPESRIVRVSRMSANAREREKLDLQKGAKVIRLKRVRFLDNKPVISEHITLPRAVFPSFEKQRKIPNTLYELYESRYDVKVRKAIEKIRAVGLEEEDAALLNLEPGTPVLEIDRTAVSIEEIPVEWRLSYVHTDDYFYLSELI